RVDAIESLVFRLPLDGGPGAMFDVSSSGDLLASTGDFTFVRYAPRQPMSSYDDSWLDFGVIDSSGVINPGWTGNVPRLVPNTAIVHDEHVYVGGRLHYHDGAAFVGVVSLAVGARSGDVIGCTPTVVAAAHEWATVYGITADETGIYALIDRTDVRPTE